MDSTARPGAFSSEADTGSRQENASKTADIDHATRAAIHATWRVAQPRLIATLSRMLRDVPLAEELTQDALVAALEAWPHSGVPDNPGAWLVATAKRRGLDHLRRAKCSPASRTC
ncbi:putative RNA polymerase sigma factor [Bradyrhizobium japonicum]|nr:putative RNA polymerase sigma factor [Bradyrhizobium japonicum]MCW2348383.1 putative RNA polymerase sigma factor [Bradyrhizobium japonicum]